jgi:hypothetical protein
MHDRHAPEFEQIDIFMFLIHPFGRHLQRVFVSKHILPLALGMRLWRPKQPDEIRVGNSLPEATRIEATSFFPGIQIPEARMELPLGEMAR